MTSVAVHNRERALLLAAVRTWPDQTATEQVHALTEHPIDWAALLRAAEYHGVIPLLYRTLRTATGVPQPVLADLTERYWANAEYVLYMSAELLDLLALFGAHGIAAIPYKGPALAAHVYGDLTLRQFGDLDLLLHERDIARAADLLVQRGYQPEHRLNARARTMYMRTECEYNLDRRDPPAHVELHWHVLPPRYGLALDLSPVWHRTERTTIAGQSVPVLRPDDLLLVLSIHAAKHAFRHLKLICDIAHLVQSNPSLDWPDLLARARAIGGERAVLTGLLLAHVLLEVPLAPPVRAALRRQRGIGTIARRIAEMTLTGTTPVPAAREWALQFSLRDGMRHRAAYLVSGLLNPPQHERGVIVLPWPLWPLYQPMRAARLASSLTRGRTPRRGGAR